MELNEFDSSRIDENEVFDPSQSMFLEASAGTGKTYTIQQIIARLVRDETPLNKILIVTYTEKAAGELRDRIRAKLEEVIEDQVIVPEHKDCLEKRLSNQQIKLFKAALRSVDEAQIYTFHSFCQKTLSTFAYDAWRPFDMDLVDDGAVKVLIERKLRDEWPQNPDFCELVLEAGQLDVKGLCDSIEELMCALINNYYLDRNGNECSNIVSLDSVVVPELTEYDERYKNVSSYQDLIRIEEFRNIIEILNENQDVYLNKSKTKKVENLLDDLKNYVAEKKLVNGRSYKSVYDGNEEVTAAFEALQRIDKTLRDVESRCKALKQRFVMTETPRLFMEWRREKMNNKKQSYSDMIAAVHQAVVLDDDCDLRERLRESYRYAIIDEFQDTNPLQWDIFKKLFLNVEHHSIFVVGDPKQSIYSFQGADLTVYQNAIDEIGNGRRLKTNYRSTSDMIENCNKLFGAEAFFKDCFDHAEFERSEVPSTEKAAALFDGEKTQAFWISDDNVSNIQFAEMVAERIVDCCEIVNGKTRLQIFKKKSPGEYRDVSFKDFAILAKSRGEFAAMRNVLKKLGIPFVEYKDKSLFKSRECLEWASLFSAIDADSFASYDRKILNEALMTDFFELAPEGDSSTPFKVKFVDNMYYDDPNCRERLWLADWHSLARRYMWAELQERIYRDTQIDIRMSKDLSNLQAIAKIRQIGTYCIDYLYKHHCVLADLVNHLRSLYENENVKEDDSGSLVARGTDFDAVQLMTMHASKGLEFPVVIVVGGLIGQNKNSSVFLYHGDEQSHGKKIGLSEDAKKKRLSEELHEWQRLFYVAYTRASSLLMLPRYEKWKKQESKNNGKESKNSGKESKSSGKESNTNEYAFLRESLNALCEQYSGDVKVCKTIHDFKNPEHLDALKARVTSILNQNTSDEINDELTQQDQLKEIHSLQKNVGKLSLIQHSYSSLSGKVELKRIEREQDIIDGDGKIMILEDEDTSESDERQWVLEPNVDLHPKQINHPDEYIVQTDEAENRDFPRGSLLGNAIHEILEEVGFENAQQPLDQFSKQVELKALIQRCFEKYGMSITLHPDWFESAAGFIWHTLNAKLPVIDGANAGNGFMTLSSLRDSQHYAEVEFMLNGDHSDDDQYVRLGQYFCKGYIDLLFVREDDEHINKRYCILDWKSDYMPQESYACPRTLKERVDRDYAVQRVLYAYCLIQWLSKFIHKSPEEIFNEHFGGIYYAFVRGCRAGTSNGIYAQTWDSYETLEKSYHSLKGLMLKPVPKEKEND